jgi:ribosomal protein L7Ae-like RNA K-turn-binding protein
MIATTTTTTKSVREKMKHNLKRKEIKFGYYYFTTALKKDSTQLLQISSDDT